LSTGCALADDARSGAVSEQPQTFAKRESRGGDGFSGQRAGTTSDDGGAGAGADGWRESRRVGKRGAEFVGRIGRIKIDVFEVATVAIGAAWVVAA
jgi:hypothetical protein